MGSAPSFISISTEILGDSVSTINNINSPGFLSQLQNDLNYITLGLTALDKIIPGLPGLSAAQFTANEAKAIAAGAQLANAYHQLKTGTGNETDVINAAFGLVSGITGMIGALPLEGLGPEGVAVVELANFVSFVCAAEGTPAGSLWLKSTLSLMESINILSLSIAPTTPITGSGMDSPGQTSPAAANYTLINNGDGSFYLTYGNGVAFYYSSTSQQWSFPDVNNDGGMAVYSRDTNASVSFGEWTVQQINASGAITLTTTLTGNIPGESLTLSKGSGSNPFITGTGEITAIPNGLTTAEAMAYFEATGTPISFGDQTANNANGNAQTFTLYASATSSIAQTITLALTGGSGNNIVVSDFSLDDVANDAEWRMAA